MANEKVIVKESINKVVVSTPGPQGPRGKTIFNGIGAPANNLGLTGDFYYNIATTEFYGPKTTDLSWSGANIIRLNRESSDAAYSISWEIAQVVFDNSNNYYYIEIPHNLGFYPNATIKNSAQDVLETGIEYLNTNNIKLTMAQPFSGTAYLS